MVTLQQRHATGLISIYISMLWTSFLVQSDFVRRGQNPIIYIHSSRYYLCLPVRVCFSGADTDRKCYLYICSRHCTHCLILNSVLTWPKHLCTCMLFCSVLKYSPQLKLYWLQFIICSFESMKQLVDSIHLRI